MSELDPNPAEAPPRGRVRGLMDRFIDTIELIAAIFVGIVAANIFIAVLLRNLFSTAIPDSYNFGQYLLGILIFWGIAATRSSRSSDEHQRHRHHRLRGVVRPDADARAGRHGDGPGRGDRLRLDRRQRTGPQADRTDLDAHGDRLQFR